METKEYQAPAIGLIEIYIEKGFAQSGDAPINQWNPSEL